MSTTPTQQPPPNGAVGFIRPPRRQRRTVANMKWNPEAEKKRQLRDAQNRFERAEKEWKSMAQDRQEEIPRPRLEDFLPVEGQPNVQTVEEAAALRAEDDDFHAPVTLPTVSDTPGVNLPPAPQAAPDSTPAVPLPPVNEMAKKRAKAATKADRDTIQDDDVMPEPPQIDIP